MGPDEGIASPAPDITPSDTAPAKKAFEKYRTRVDYNKPYIYPYEDALLDTYFTLLSDIRKIQDLTTVPEEALVDADEEPTALKKTMKEAGILLHD